MGKKSTPTAPTPPDPYATASAQSKSNIDTANAAATLSNANQVTPWGSQTWTQAPANPGKWTPGTEGRQNEDGSWTEGTPGKWTEGSPGQWTSTIALSPEQQDLLNSDNQISKLMAQLGLTQAGKAADSLASQQSLPLASSINMGGLTDFQRSVGTGPMQGSIDTSGTENLTRGVDASGIQKKLNADPAALRVMAKDLSAGNPNQTAAYNMQKQYLDSDYGQRESSLENKLIQQGVLQGSDAWNKATQNLGQQRTFDYNNAFNNSFATGLAAGGQQFDQELAGNNQYFNQDLASGDFVNRAQGQQFGQNFANAELNNRAAGQLAQQRMGQAELANSAQGQSFMQDFANAGLSNSSNQSLFNAKIDLAELNNRASAQQIQQEQAPINLLNALRNGSQVTSPNFTGTPQQNVANTDIAGLINNQFGSQMNEYNNQFNSAQSNRNSTTQAAGSLASSYMMYLAMASDRRTKENVVQVGIRADGLGVYRFEYRPEFKEWGEGEFIGVMADEVETIYPHAISIHPDGYKLVNYGALHG